MVNYGIIEAGIFFLLVGILAYYSLHLPMILSAAIGGLGLLAILIGIIWKKPVDKNRKKSKK
jgi:O-antigen/teichoic acid export membrane protein